MLTTQPVVEVRNASGQLDGGATAAVTASIASGSGTLTGTTTSNAVGGVARFTDLGVAGGGAHTLRFSAAGLTASTSTVFTVTQTASGFVIQVPPGGAVDGSPLTTQPRLQVVDLAGLPMSGAAIPVTASIAGGTGTLSGTTTVTSVGGVASYTDLAITGAGPHLLAFASPGVQRAVSDQFSVQATSGAATRLVITTQPSGGTTGAPLPVQPVIAVRDAADVTVPGSTVAVTASIEAGDGTMSGTTTVNAVDGVATFTNLTITGPGTYTLRFTSAGLTDALSTQIRILAAALRAP